MNPAIAEFRDLIEYCQAHQCSVGQAALDYEVDRRERESEEILEQVTGLLTQMRATIDSGLYSEEKSMSGLTGGLSKQMIEFDGSDQAFLSTTQHKMMAYALSTLEENSRMKRIVACPTAGASGVVPGTLMAVAEAKNIPMDKLAYGLLTAGMIGEIISRRMHLSGAAAGCQAEVGVSAGMAAGAIVQVLGGTPEQVLSAVSIALKNTMGLVCDPVAGLVEVPCVKRNAIGVMIASGAATMALAGIASFIPTDEVVDAMVKVGKLMSPKLKESAEGGLAMTQTAQAFTQELKLKQD